MSKYEKLLERVYSLDSNMRFDELKTILESLGYTMSAPSGGSSHRTFRKEGCMPITIPKHNPIKKTYVRKLRELLESEENNA